MEKYGYGRISTMEQNERCQMDIFLAEGIDERHNYIFTPGLILEEWLKRTAHYIY